MRRASRTEDRTPRRLMLLAPIVVTIAAFPRMAVAQCPSQIKPRVMVLVDTSASMTLHMADVNASGGDGSISYSDVFMTRQLATTPGFALYPGYRISGSGCPNTSTSLSSYDGINSRMYAVKGAVANTTLAAGELDWGLERYAGTTCPVVNTTTNTGGACTNDSSCAAGSFCLTGSCRANNNLCFSAPAYDVACNVRLSTNATYGGNCGTSASAGNAACATQQVCYADADCAVGFAGQCGLIGSGPALSCKCTGPSDCPAGYTCTGLRCVYNLGCQNPGGVVLVDPSVSGSNAQIPQWTDGIESSGANPELRASGLAPLAGAARTATAWYNNIKNASLDPQIICRPYVLVEIVGSLDTCDADATKGPVAAAGGFVAATASFAKRANKVYVIGVGFGAAPVPALDAIAKAGGSGSARLASNRGDVDAALADIAQATTLVERCNGADDDCNGLCDESFPDVAVSGPSCSNPRTAKTCTNQGLPNTHCFASGLVACSGDQLSEVCTAPTCASNTSLCPTPEPAGGCNGVDDDCNGVLDDCTSGVANSCCP